MKKYLLTLWVLLCVLCIPAAGMGEESAASQSGDSYEGWVMEEIPALGLFVRVPQGWSLQKTYDSPSMVDFEMRGSESQGGVLYVLTAVRDAQYDDLLLDTLDDGAVRSLLWAAGLQGTEHSILQEGPLGQTALDVVDAQNTARHLLFVWDGWLVSLSAQPQKGEVLTQAQLAIRLEMLGILPEKHTFALQGLELSVIMPEEYALSTFSSLDMQYFLLKPPTEEEATYTFLELKVPGISANDDFAQLTDEEMQTLVAMVSPDIAGAQLQKAGKNAFGATVLEVDSGDGAVHLEMFVLNGLIYSASAEHPAGVTAPEKQELARVFTLEVSEE